MDESGDISMTPPATTMRHLSYINTPEPLVGRSRAAAVSFKDDSAALLPDASATFTIGQPTKTLSGSPQWQQVLDTVQWKNPAVSALVLLLGAFCALAGEFILRGNHTVTPLKGEPFIFNPLRGNSISYLILGDLTVNTLRSMVSAQWQDKAAWSSSSVIANAAEGAKQVVLRIAKLHDELLSAKDPVLTLRLAASLCMLGLLSNIFSMWRLVCLAFFGVFAWAVTWDMYGAQDRWKGLRLSRRQKAVALTIASLCIWASTGWTTRLQVVLLGALTVRCNLKPAEVDAIITRAEPYVHSAKKRARRLSVAATDYVRRHSFGPAQPKTHEK